MNTTVNFTVKADGSVSPITPQPGGVVGEDNSVSVCFDVSAISIGSSDLVRIDFANGAGGFFSSEHLSVADSKVTYLLPYEVTTAGGTAQLHLVVTTFNDSDEEVIRYSFPARIYFESSAIGSVGYNAYRKGLSGLVVEANEAAESASASANDAAESQTAAAKSANDADSAATGAAYSAQSASASAESASASATEAAQSAKNAEQYAGEAESSAYGASQFAQSASESAESAETSKTEAAQSANDASGYVSAASQFAQSAEGYAKNAEQYATYASNSAQSAATSAEALTSHNESEEAHSALFAEVKSEVESAQITADMADINAATAQSKANTAYAKANLPFGITGSMLSAATEIAFNYYLMSDSGVPEQHYLKLDLTDFGFTEDMLSETEMSLAVYFDLVDGEWVATIEPSDTAVKVFTWNLNKNGLIDLVPADMGYTMFSRSNHTHAVATTSANGFMSASDKVKFKAMQSKVNSIDDDQKALLARLIDCGAVKQPVYIEHSAILTMTDVPYIEYTSSDFANPVTNIIGSNAVSSFVSSVSMVNNNLSEISVAIGTYETSEYPQFVHIDVNNGYMKSNTFINPINMERAETGTYTPSRDSFEITGDDMAITYDMCRAVVFDSSELEDPTRFKIVSEKLKSVSDEEYGDYVFQGTAPEYFIFEDDVVIQTVSSPDGSVIEFYNSETNELIYEWNTTETGGFYMSEKFEYCPHIKIIQKNT